MNNEATEVLTRCANILNSTAFFVVNEAKKATLENDIIALYKVQVDARRVFSDFAPTGARLQDELDRITPSMTREEFLKVRRTGATYKLPRRIRAVVWTIYVNNCLFAVNRAHRTAETFSEAFACLAG